MATCSKQSRLHLFDLAHSLAALLPRTHSAQSPQMSGAGPPSAPNLARSTSSGTAAAVLWKSITVITLITSGRKFVVVE